MIEHYAKDHPEMEQPNGVYRHGDDFRFCPYCNGTPRETRCRLCGRPRTPEGGCEGGC